jgi:membrane protease subunit HflK
MDRSIQRNGLINLLALIAVGVAGFGVARFNNSLGGQVSILFIGLAAMVAGVSWFQMRLEESERLEKLELEEMSRIHSSSNLFEGADAEIFPAQRSREQFERFFVPIFTVIMCLVQAGGAYFFWRWLSNKTINIEIRQPMVPMFLFGIVFFLILFLLGKYSSEMARLENHRLLRPGAAAVLLSAYLSLLVGIGIAGVLAEFKRADLYVAYGLCCLLALIAVETLINLVLEMYRPRVKGKIGRPLYESRLVGLLGHPEGLITTAGQALDYQFGFKVSETWFYRLFVEKALMWFILLQIGVLILSTTVVFIDAGEQGLLERFGRPVAGGTLLDAGAHFKLPWPIDRVYRFRTEQIQTFEIGTSPDALREEGRAVLWTVAHTKEDNFVVANRDQVSSANTNGPGNKAAPPVSLITGTIPVQFQITNLISWAYNNEDASSLLQDLASREIVRYLVNADMNEIMSFGRGAASEALATRIQTAADQMRMGARILAVGLEDLHPPVKVAPDYEKVVAAIQTKQAKILAAQADQIRTNALAEAQAATLLNQAQASRMETETRALSQAALFTNQVLAFEAAPSVYAERAYLETFVRATANARKYLLLTTNKHDVINFDWQDKFRQDLFDLSPKAK